MPGAFGYWCEDSRQNRLSLIEAMSSSMLHSELLESEHVLVPGFGAGLVSLAASRGGLVQDNDQSSRYYLLLDGELINSKNLVDTYDIDTNRNWSDAEIVLNLYLKVGWTFLRHVDGLFIIVLYDRLEHCLTIASDRYGLRPLYIMHDMAGVGFAGEVKALLKLPHAKLTIDRQAIAEWFSFGQLLGDTTWIEGVKLFPPGTVMQISRRGVVTDSYWSWSHISQQKASSEMEFVEELGRLWTQAVERRVSDQRLSVFLSGGLDSRAVLAALVENDYDITAVTFGELNSLDLSIARQVTSLKKISHHYIELNSHNWLENRIKGVWLTDGMLSFIHLHGFRGVEELPSVIDLDIQSFAGDLILGGSYLKRDYIENWGRSRDLVFRSMYMRSDLIPEDIALELLSDIYSSYSELSHSDYFFLENRVRRFTNCGTIALRSYIKRHFPTYDNELIEFIYSQNPELRYGGRLYKRMLLDRFPEYYSDIPWQKTGLPIGKPVWRHKQKALARYLGHQISRFPWMGDNFHSRRKTFANYVEWMRQEPARALIIQLIYSENALFPAYIDGAVARGIVDSFMAGKSNDHNIVSLLCTFEILLLRLFEQPHQNNGNVNLPL